MRIKVNKLLNDAVLPKFNYDKDDLVIYGIGLAFEIPKVYYMQLSPRSSIYKYNLELVNSIGIVDAGYRGEVKFVFRIQNYNHDDIFNYKVYEIGDRIGQAIIRKIEPTEYIETNQLEDSDRGVGGFGSTGVS
jgi:dUTP pyrophosphatase